MILETIETNSCYERVPFSLFQRPKAITQPIQRVLVDTVDMCTLFNSSNMIIFEIKVKVASRRTKRIDSLLKIIAHLRKESL